MKYICLGYIEPNKFESMSESEQKAMLDECFGYDDQLRKNGHWVGGEAIRAGIDSKESAEREGRSPNPIASAVAKVPELIGFHIGR